MRRGDLVTVAMPGDFGKPRPALVIQADQFDNTSTLTLALLSGTLVDAPLIRLTIAPTTANGLRKTSQIMIDKIMTVKRERVGSVFGRVEDDILLATNRLLALFLGFA
ncbi:type II toxin-antitoxin system PemK/MazF family toxin [Niveispirillum sp.]|uniref:type II toxin-antitoxin system PemK/MazF family toxin n=1 Tax=Niveispirillum sp. TaxID=1917217 RepID=UPI001B6DCB63|nr:type II toxin-antitoxin system PemK/MazF family toxin [Niveispirillum sp.]MBP7339040.1 type II toxin-antitoxin system PemK/MazF family toxin [Niveispirillum sp.]